MSKDNTASGLLSKLVKCVRNPATSWTELDTVQADKDDSVNKQLLKEMIERKRRNDFVRKREFEMLRKLRKREAVVELSQDPAGKPSFFQSSLLSRPDDRASTLKKIDEIEAQMSMQWWKTKEHHASENTVNPALMKSGGDISTQPPAADSTLPLAYRPTAPAEMPSAARIAELAQKPLLDNLFKTPAQRAAKSGLRGNASVDDSGPSGLSAFTPSPSPLPGLAVESAHDMLVHDAELEEAAILFANGDDAGAEAGLLEILAPGALRADHVETWLALFDFYRATGGQDKFETAAIQFAKRFGRSAPQWFCLPDMVKALAKPTDKAHGAATDWICPSVVGLQTVAALNAATARAAMPWRLDWSNLKSIEASALEPLCKVFKGWATQSVQLRFIDDAKLQAVLRDATPSGERLTDQKWWLLRMEVLRVIHRPDDFELTALDFCVTYEVSPPSWESARCEYKPLDAQGDVVGRHTIVGEPVHSTLNPLDMDSLGSPTSQINQLLSVELSGQIQGDAIGVLDQLEDRVMGADAIQIACSKLIRVDFSAAGMLLNWVSARQVENRSVQFSEVNRLVAAFFNVIGITEYAKVIVRVD